MKSSKYLLIFGLASVPVLVVPMLAGHAPAVEDFWKALGAGLVAALGLHLPSPRAVI